MKSSYSLNTMQMEELFLPEREVPGVSSCMPDELISISESFMAVLAGVPFVVALMNPEMLC